MSGFITGIHNTLSSVALAIWCDAKYIQVSRTGASIGDASQSTEITHDCKAQINEAKSGQRSGNGVQTENRTVFIATRSLPDDFDICTGDRVEVSYPFGVVEKLTLTGVSSRDPAGVYYQCEIQE